MKLTLIKQTDILKYSEQIDKCNQFFAGEINLKGEQVEIFSKIILQNLVAGLLQLWVLPKEDGTVKALIMTKVSTVHTVLKSLHLYALIGFEKLTDKEYEEGFALLKQFARDNNCNLITGQSHNEKIINKFKELGGTGYSLNLCWEI